MLKATAIVAATLLAGVSTFALADAPSDTPQQVAQAQSRSQMDADFQKRLSAAKTPEERARIQAEHDRMIQQQGAVPDGGSAVRTAPGTAGSGAMPDRPDGLSQPGMSPGGGSATPKGQSGD